MDFDLVSAYSARVFWKADFKASHIHCQSDASNTDSNLNTSAKCENGEGAVVVVNLKPSTTYTVNVFSETGDVLSNRFTTRDYTNPELQNLYNGVRMADGVYDTTRFDKTLHDVFVANFSEIITSGDKILAPVVVNGVSHHVEAVGVQEGTCMKIEDENLPNVFLPFSSEKLDTPQTVSLQRQGIDATLAYDSSANNFSYGGESYGVGDRFEMFGQTVTVGDGSIVLIFSDTVSKTWPFASSKALSVVGAAGSHFMKNITANVANLVGQKADGETGSTYNSAWIHNTTDSTTVEISRTTHQLDELSENATLSFGVLHTDDANNKFVEPTLQMAYDNTTISTQDDNDATTSATFKSDGLSFDTDDASIYFGADKNFRIRFASGTPSLLQIQSYDSVAGEYVTRQEVSDAT